MFKKFNDSWLSTVLSPFILIAVMLIGGMALVAFCKFMIYLTTLGTLGAFLFAVVVSIVLLILNWIFY